MVYELTDNRITIGDYFFEMDTNNIIYIYGKGMKCIDKIEIGHSMNFEKFKIYCENYINN